MTKKTLLLLLLAATICFTGCWKAEGEDVGWPVSAAAGTLTSRAAETHPLETAFAGAGMIDVHTLDTTIRVLLRYGTTDNFMGIDLYGGFNKCYLQPEVAAMLVRSQLELRRRNSDLSLLVWDAARPLSVQQRMWDEAVPPPGVHRSKFVSNPRYGSLHNFGCAVDITMVRSDGTLLDMGTDLDYFGREAWPSAEQEMLKKGKLTPDQIQNRELLRSVMRAGGFWNIQSEWWHFNAMRRETARERYPMVR
jgi:zinc D-Ala-D-Ala dipeptidase